MFSLFALVLGSALCLVFSFLGLLLPSLSFPLPFSMASTPPTSPQRSQAAGRYAERASRTLGSPEQHRTPAGLSEPSAAAAAPSLPSREPITFQGQTYHNLPTDLAARLTNLPPLLPTAPRRRRPSSTIPFYAPTSVSLLLFIKSILNIIYILQIIPPSVSISGPSTLAPPFITRRHSAMPLLTPTPVSFNFLLLLGINYNITFRLFCH